MGMIQCKECGAAISDRAGACPQCGGKVPRTKWWLWIPLGLCSAFLLYGHSIPEYVSRANELRRSCEKMFPLQNAECERIYDKTIREGKFAGQSPESRAYVPTAYDIGEQKKKAEKEAADNVVEARVCQSKSAEMAAEFRQLMTAGEYWPAALSIRRCAQLTNDPKLTVMVADAEIRSYVRDIEDPKTPIADRVRFIEALSGDYPERGKKYASLLKKLSADGSK